MKSSLFITVYLEDRCDSIVHQSVDDTVTIRLARSSGNDRKNCQTKLILHTKDDAQLFVSFSEFQLAPAEDPTVCLQHFLQVSRRCSICSPFSLYLRPGLNDCMIGPIDLLMSELRSLGLA